MFKLIIQIIVIFVFIYLIWNRDTTPRWKEESFQADLLNSLCGRNVYREPKKKKENG